MFPELTELIRECDATPGYRVRYDGEVMRLSKYHEDHRERRLAQMRARHAANRQEHIEKMRENRRRKKGVVV